MIAKSRQSHDSCTRPGARAAAARVHRGWTGPLLMTDQLAYTIGQAAESMGISESTVRRMIEDREIPVVRLRGNVRIPVSALTTWLDETALAAVKAEAVNDYIAGGREPTVMIGGGSRRKARQKGASR